MKHQILFLTFIQSPIPSSQEQAQLPYDITSNLAANISFSLPRGITTFIDFEYCRHDIVDSLENLNLYNSKLFYLHYNNDPNKLDSVLESGDRKSTHFLP